MWLNHPNPQENSDQYQFLEEYRLDSVFPNPFNSSTIISYDVPGDSRVKVCLFDMQGRLRSELINQRHRAGHHQLILEAGDLPTGL